MRTQLATLALTLSLASNAAAQSLNIDFGAAGTPPPSSYAATGLAGTWNEIAVLPPGQRAPLVGLDGALVAAQIYMIGGTALLASDDPATTGDDNAFVDDMLIGYNDPVDVCVWVENLVNGNYTVVLYALTPNSMRRSRIASASISRRPTRRRSAARGPAVTSTACRTCGSPSR